MTTQIIRDAISRSISHTEIVHVTIEGNDDIHELVTAAYAGEWDYSDENPDEDGNQVLDVYSLESESDSWRINVTIVGASNHHPEGCSCGSPDCPEWIADQEVVRFSLTVGDRVEAGTGDDYDTGIVDSIDGDTATVRWDSHVVTTAPVSDLRRIGGAI